MRAISTCKNEDRLEFVKTLQNRLSRFCYAVQHFREIETQCYLAREISQTIAACDMVGFMKLWRAFVVKQFHKKKNSFLLRVKLSSRCFASQTNQN